MLKNRATEEYVQMEDMEWAKFPEGLAGGDIYWRLLHVSPEMGSWTAVFDCRAGSSFATHIHAGPGEYFLYEGKMDVRGGVDNGGDTAIAPGYGFEASGVLHEKTYFPIDSKFYMTFLGPLNFLDTCGNVIASVGWVEVQEVWNEYMKTKKAA